MNIDMRFVKAAAEALRRTTGVEPRPIDELLSAKAESDRRNYPAKHVILRRMMHRSPHEFHVDSEDRGIVGLTHSPTRFRIHAPRSVVPQPVLLRRAAEASNVH